jgi:DNA-binding response OmpR family regulator
MPRVLIVAPDMDLRRSLEFLLEADGYAVVSCASVGAARNLGRFDCAILDHQAIAPPHEDVLEFCREARPLILLSGSAHPWLAEGVFQVVQKPLLGKPLLAAVEDALRSTETARSTR